ncbi:MAG: hypothetical protein P8Y12_04525 [Gammaproteobacteria bacterium]
MKDKIRIESSQKNSRRAFVKTCLATATMVAANPARIAMADPVRQYSRALLKDEKGNPIHSSFIEENEAFVFHYPYVTTPCFLINLGRSMQPGQVLTTKDNDDYIWQGGAGPTQSIVAFSAICAHKLSYPTKSLSFLNYRPEKIRIVGPDEEIKERSQTIYCCSERSAYDPTRGAQVIGGPASQPLAAVELEYDKDLDQYYAVGTRGGELYDNFFEKFGFRIALEHKIENIRARVEIVTTVFLLSSYSNHAVSC